MEPTDWIALAGIVATALVSVVTLILGQRTRREQQARDDRIRREQQEREDRQRQEQQAREDQIREQERFGAPHIEFSVECNTYGPEGDG
jgi:membrane protein implicated in regulation of membrane protease activity